MSINYVTYPVKIRFVETIENKLSLFTVLEHKVVETSLKVLVSYQRHAAGDPEVQAIWEGCKCRLFLICEKLETYRLDRSTGYCEPPKEQSAWIDIDLTPLSLNKTIHVYTHQLAEGRGLEVGQQNTQVKESYDELVAEIHF
jgi:hypothetical protein